MKRVLVLLILAVLISSCSKIDGYIKHLTHKPSLLIGYQKVKLREGVPPLIEIEFSDNDVTVREAIFDEIGTILKKNTYYVVEATAGGFTNQSQQLVQRRISEMIKILEAYNIDSNYIYVAEYTAKKKGRRGYIYSITHDELF